MKDKPKEILNMTRLLILFFLVIVSLPAFGSVFSSSDFLGVCESYSHFTAVFTPNASGGITIPSYVVNDFTDMCESGPFVAVYVPAGGGSVVIPGYVVDDFTDMCESGPFVAVYAPVGGGVSQTTQWYSNGELYTTTNCNGNNITTPSNPTPPKGATFAGWTPIYQLSNLNSSIDGTGYTDNPSMMVWTTIFNYGYISGRALCSSTSANNFGNTGTPNESGGGEYCWCRIISFNDGSTDFVPAVSLWAFASTYGSASVCASRCSNYCGYSVQHYSPFRSALFGSVAN